MNTATKKSALEKLLSTYEEALNASNAEELLLLFSKNGVLMPNGAPATKGQEQLKAAYENLFKAFQLSVEYFIDEIIVHGEYAFVRTNSKGNTLIRANGETIPINNKELFVMHEENGGWKVFNYIFNANQMK